MKKVIFSLLLTLSFTYSQPSPALEHRANAMRLIVDSAQNIVIPDALNNIFKELGIERSEKIPPLIAAVQSKWLRKSGQERWQMPVITIEHQTELSSNFRELGLIDEIYPLSKQYNYALVLGCSVPKVKLRLAHLVKLWNEGIRFKQIVFLTADRALDPSYEGKEAILYDMPEALPLNASATTKHLPKTESEAMAFYYQNCSLPAGLKALPLQVVTAQTNKNALGIKHRPNTGDTVVSWFKYKPRPGKVLAISSQPYVGYQFSILRHILPPSFDLEVVGEKVSSKVNPAIFLDTIARWMFVEICEYD